MRDDLIQLELVTDLKDTKHAAANGAPEGEPEVWDETVPAYNPHLDHTPEPYPVNVSPEFASQTFDIGDYLAEERAKDLLRFSTAGSVDDGKSTLIGRLLYDTQSVYDDQISSIEGKGTTAPGVLDLALLTDGLRAEREQGITIDVAYRYFSTPRRKFIIADTPGHEQYTRNMATGASTADVAIVLIDARKGVLSQSRRHAYITALLGVRHIILAVNKMDLVEYAEPVFESIREDFTKFFEALDVDGREATKLHFVPVSALAGDNVVHVTQAMPWYKGPSLLALLEELPSSQVDLEAPFRFAVQRVIRPNLDFRGFAGQIASGTVRVGDRLDVMRSGQSSRVKSIVTFDGDLQEAFAPLSVTLTLEDEIDISRGDLLAEPDKSAQVTSSFTASLVWMDSAPLDTTKRYLLKHMSRTVQAQVRTLQSIVDIAQGSASAPEAEQELGLNAIGQVEVEVLQPIAIDPYAKNRHTGSFALIDPQSNLTVAAGMVRFATAGAAKASVDAVADGPVTADERAKRYGHTGVHLEIIGPPSFQDAVERALFERGAIVLRLPRIEAVVAESFAATGAIVLTATAGNDESSMQAHVVGTGQTLVAGDEGDLRTAVRTLLEKLQAAGILRGGGVA
jgi:sulfate adenylyltransferase subunit 1